MTLFYAGNSDTLIIHSRLFTMSNFQLFPSSYGKAAPSVCLTEGRNAFDNGWVDLTSTGVKCKLHLYDTAVWRLQDLITGYKEAVVKRSPYIELFDQVRELYPDIAPGGLVFNDRCCYCYYDEMLKCVSMQTDKPLSVLLHELGHAYAHAYYPSHVSDEELAWDTAKSLALEIGYQWTEADAKYMVQCLASYGITL